MSTSELDLYSYTNDVADSTKCNKGVRIQSFGLFFFSNVLFVNKKYCIQNIKNSSVEQESFKTLHAESSFSSVLKPRPSEFPGFQQDYKQRDSSVTML